MNRYNHREEMIMSFGLPVNVMNLYRNVAVANLVEELDIYNVRSEGILG